MTDAWIAIAVLFTHLGGPVAAVIFAFAIGYRHQRARLAPVAALLAAVVTEAVKRTVQRPRPEIETEGMAWWLEYTVDPIGYSWPSGHALMSSAVAFYVALRFPDRRVRALAVVYILMIAWTRLSLGVHRPDEILAGWTFGLGVALLVHLVECSRRG